MTNPAAPSEDWANALTDFVDEIGGDGPGLWKWAGITPTPKEVVDELRLLFKHSEQRATASGARSVLKFDPQDSDESIRLAWGDMTPDQAVKGLKALVGHLNGLAAPPVPQTSAPGAEFLRPTMDEVMGLAKMFGVEVNDCHALMWLVVTSIAAWGDGPEPTSTAPVAWCRSDEFAQLAHGREYFFAVSERHPNYDMPLYAHPQASTAQPGPKPGDIAELCAEFEYHIDSDDYHSIGILRDMITAAITRWLSPATLPAQGEVGELVELLQQEAGCYDPCTDVRAALFTRIAELLKGFTMGGWIVPTVEQTTPPASEVQGVAVDRYEFSVYDGDDQQVVAGGARDFEVVFAEGRHHLRQYNSDGRHRLELRRVLVLDLSGAAHDHA